MTLRSIQLTQAPPRFSMTLRCKGARASINAIPNRTNRLVVVEKYLKDDALLPAPPGGINTLSLDPSTLISTDPGQKIIIGTDGKLFVGGPEFATAQW